jgi:hypothetical protein
MRVLQAGQTTVSTPSIVACFQYVVGARHQQAESSMTEKRSTMIRMIEFAVLSALLPVARKVAMDPLPPLPIKITIYDETRRRETNSSVGEQLQDEATVRALCSLSPVF